MGPVQARGDRRLGHVQARRHFPGRPVLQVAQPDDEAVRRWEAGDGAQHEQTEPSAVDVVFRTCTEWCHG